MKIDAQMLGKLIREVVRDELRRSLPGLVQRHLSEAYIRRLVGENVRRTVPLAEALADDPPDPEHDEVPEPLSNRDDGIYQKNPLVRGKEVNEGVARLLSSRTNPLAEIFEGVRPVPADGEHPVPGEVPEALVEQLDMGRMAKIAGLSVQGRAAQAPPDARAEFEETRLRRHREMLDRPANGTPVRRAPAPPPVGRPLLGAVSDPTDDPFRPVQWENLKR